jgi:GNAT acetyltransferase
MRAPVIAESEDVTPLADHRSKARSNHPLHQGGKSRSSSDALNKPPLRDKQGLIHACASHASQLGGILPNPARLTPNRSPRRGRISLQFTPALQLETLFVLNEAGRIVSTREPNPASGPLFTLIRDATRCSWAIHRDVPADRAHQLDALAREERATHDLQREPLHSRRYMSLLGGTVESGPVFTFPETLPTSRDTITIEHLEKLERHFQGWKSNELSGCAPIVAIVEDGHAVSVCFCARRSRRAAEAGLETAKSFRAAGLGTRVTAAWALAIRTLGLLPLYSTSWTNMASLAVARKLGLDVSGSDWNVSH